MSLIYAPASLIGTSATAFSYLLYKSYPDIINGGSHKSPLLHDFVKVAPILRVTLGWFSLFFAFLFYQSWSKFYALKALKKESKAKDSKVPSFVDVKYGMAAGNKHFALNADRTVGNMMEQSLPFLVSLWLHAIFVDIGSAAQLGWIWLLFRAIYPVVFARGVPLLFLSTVPGYSILVLLCYPLWQMAL